MKYALYYFDACPFCQRVLRVLPELKVDVEKRNVRLEPKWSRQQEDETGRTQVPCLLIEKDGKHEWLYESADIIRYLQSQ